MPTDERPPLSERETEILGLVATGKTNQEIARALIISPNTVKVHLRNIFEKLNVQSRTEATLFAIRNGLVQIETPTVPNPAIQPPHAMPAAPPIMDTAAPPAVDDAAGPAPVIVEPLQAMTLRTPQVPIARWQRAYLLASLLLMMLALLAPQIESAFSRSRATGANLLSDARLAQTGLPPRQDTARWRVRAPLPGPRARHAQTAFRNQVYVIGGETPTGLTDSVDVFDPERNDWQPRSNLPQPLSNIEATVLKNLIYVAGGVTSSGEITAEFLSYDPVADAWGQAPPLPAPRAGYALAASDTALFVIGGWDGAEVVNTVFIYDPARLLWRSGPALPSGRALAGAVVLADQLIVVGGFDGAQAQPTMFRLPLAAGGQPAQEVWEQGAPLRAARSGLAVVVEGAALYALGGGDASLDYHERYDPFSQTWSSIVSPWAGEWRGAGAAAVPPMIYISGGWSGDYAEVHEQYQAGFRTFMPNSPR